MSEHRNLLIRVVAPLILIFVVAGAENAFAWGEKDSLELALRVRAGSYESLLKAVRAPEGSFETVTLDPRPGWNHSHLFGGTAAYPQWTSKEPVPARTLVIFYSDGARGEPLEIPEFSTAKDQMEEGLWIKFEGIRNLVEIF